MVLDLTPRRAGWMVLAVVLATGVSGCTALVDFTEYCDRDDECARFDERGYTHACIEGLCQESTARAECGGGKACPDAHVCKDGSCTPTSAPKPNTDAGPTAPICKSDVDCLTTHGPTGACVANACVCACAGARACKADSECASELGQTSTCDVNSGLCVCSKATQCATGK